MPSQHTAQAATTADTQVSRRWGPWQILGACSPNLSAAGPTAMMASTRSDRGANEPGAFWLAGSATAQSNVAWPSRQSADDDARLSDRAWREHARTHTLERGELKQRARRLAPPPPPPPPPGEQYLASAIPIVVAAGARSDPRPSHAYPRRRRRMMGWHPRTRATDESRSRSRSRGRDALGVDAWALP
ncbi:hypothetical protein BKA81DRAFT_401502 [Phyllosticta paracitricarpa]